MKMKQSSWLLWPVLVLMVLLIINLMNRVPVSERLEYSKFRSYVRSGLIESVVVKGSEISGKFKPVFDNTKHTLTADEMNFAGKVYRTYAFGTGDELIKLLEEGKVAQFSTQPDDK